MDQAQAYQDEWRAVCTVRVRQNYFIVFESNASAVGRLDNMKLLEKFISVYGACKAFIEYPNWNTERNSPLHQVPSRPRLATQRSPSCNVETLPIRTKPLYFVAF
jgi:hypothetical protein